MNQQFIEFGEHDLFATALVSTFFAPSQSFSLCNAGHPVPLLFRSDKSEWSELSSDCDETEHANTPFGIIEKASYGQLEIKLRTGDMVLSFSDAVTESEDGNGRQLGSAGILRLAHDLQLTTPELVIPTLVDRLTSLADGNLHQDDATMLLIQATGAGPTLKNNLLAPFRLFGSVADKTKLGSEIVTFLGSFGFLVSLVSLDDGALLLTDAEFAYFVTLADYRASLGIVDLP